MAVRAAALHYRALGWADLLISAMLTYSIFLALVTFLPTVLATLTGSNCLEVSAGTAGQMSLPLIGGTRSFRTYA